MRRHSRRLAGPLSAAAAHAVDMFDHRISLDVFTLIAIGFTGLLVIMPASIGPDRIREKRLAAHLSQVELASKMQISTRTIQRWESGRLEPNRRHRWRLAELLGGHPADYEKEFV